MALNTRAHAWSLPLSAIALAVLPFVATASGQPPSTSSPQTSIQLTGVRLDQEFRLPGSNASGLVAAVTIDRLPRPSTTGDFTVFITDDQGKRAGEVSCLAMRFLDGASPKRWVLLDSSAGSLARSYRAMIDSGAAVVETTRNKPVETGHYEFVYLVGTSVRRGTLTYGDDRRESARLAIGSFDVPWPASR